MLAGCVPKMCSAPAGDLKTIGKQTLGDGRAQLAQTEQADGAILRSDIGQLLPSLCLLLLAIGRHGAVQIEGPGQTGFGHQVGQVGIGESNDLQWTLAEVGDYFFDPGPEAVRPNQVRQLGYLSGVWVGDDSKLDRFFLGWVR